MNGKCLRIPLILVLLCLVAPLSTLARESRFEATGSPELRAVLTCDDAPLVAMRPTRLVLQLTGKDGQPPVALKGSCDLTMPAMPMPENRPTLRPIGNELVGEAIFTMAGEWRAACTVELPGGRKETFVFSLGDVQL